MWQREYLTLYRDNIRVGLPTLVVTGSYCAVPENANYINVNRIVSGFSPRKMVPRCCLQWRQKLAADGARLVAGSATCGVPEVCLAHIPP